jgi:uncharacterized protein (TIGR03435 family)
MRFTLLLLLAPAFSHAQPPRPSFEVADLKLNKSGAMGYSVELMPGGRVMVRNLPLDTAVGLAYDVRPNMIEGKPAWFKSDHIDVAARGSRNATENDLRLMMQTLLEERLKMAVHRDEKSFEGFSLVASKTGPKLGQAEMEPSNEEGCQTPPLDAVAGEKHFRCYMSMKKLAEAIPMLGPGYVPKGVVDHTGLPGYYSFRLDWTGANFLLEKGGQSLFDSLALLGLKLESGKVSLPVIVVDHAERPDWKN